MLDPKSIFFQTELKWPPFDEFAVSEDVVRGLFNKMFEPGGYKYENLNLQSDKPTLHTNISGGQSLCQFGSESITIEESHEECNVDVFVEIVETVLKGLAEEDIPPFFLQRVKIQCLCQTANCESALELLAGKVSNVYGQAIHPFDRPPQFFGVRFRFPPVNLINAGEVDENDDSDEIGDDEIEQAIEDGRIEEKSGYVTLRLESYRKNKKQIWMEVAASYPQFEEPMARADVDKIVANIRNAYDFLTSNSKRFLDQFDTNEEEQGT